MALYSSRQGESVSEFALHVEIQESAAHGQLQEHVLIEVFEEYQSPSAHRFIAETSKINLEITSLNYKVQVENDFCEILQNTAIENQNDLCKEEPLSEFYEDQDKEPAYRIAQAPTPFALGINHHYFLNHHFLAKPRYRGHGNVKENNPGFLNNSLIAVARHNLGLPVWAFSHFANLCQRGYLGCAATVSELLQEAGLRIHGSASVSQLANELNDLGWQNIKITDKHQFQPGDIVYGLKGTHAHIGIITTANADKVLVSDNSSSTGVLKERTIESGGSFTPNGRFMGSLYVLRPKDS